MKKQDLISSEDKILYEGEVYSVNHKCKVNITITSSKIIVEKAIRIIHKILIVVDNINVKSIKLINDKPQVKLLDRRVGFSTYEGVYAFDCSNRKEARKLESALIYGKTGDTLLNRIIDSSDGILGTVEIIAGSILEAISVYHIVTRFIDKRKDVE